MLDLHRLAIVGSGPTALYVLKHIADSARAFSDHIGSIHVFEQNMQAGVGMPYSPQTTDHHNICNISSRELPRLEPSFADWLRSVDAAALRQFGLSRDDIDEDGVYSRLAMGQYFAHQFQAIVSRLKLAGIEVVAHVACRVVDIRDHSHRSTVSVVTDRNTTEEFSAVVLASGHCFDGQDDPSSGYYASPWPIQKLLPCNGNLFNATIGTLGASLSAFDVIASLAHRHGNFESRKAKHGEIMHFTPHQGCGDLSFVMHAAKGWLPHLQYEQVEPFRELYRHVSRQTLSKLRDSSGFMRLDMYFDAVCRPALVAAFELDGRSDLVDRLRQPDFNIEQFAEQMTGEHEYADAFEGMREELLKAQVSVEQDRPIHWKETFDDLMYTLNFHAHWLPAEDHLRFQTLVMPFLLNVIAAMPLRSARMLLALYDAGKLQLVAGNAQVVSHRDGLTVVEVDGESSVSQHRYRLFVDCSGQGPLQLERFPFPSLVETGAVRAARAKFAEYQSLAKLPEPERQRVVDENGAAAYQIGGIDIDSCYRVINAAGVANSRLFDVAFPHATGIRPYSYGLQACELTARMLVAGWKHALRDAAAECEALA